MAAGVRLAGADRAGDGVRSLVGAAVCDDVAVAGGDSVDVELDGLGPVPVGVGVPPLADGLADVLGDGEPVTLGLGLGPAAGAAGAAGATAGAPRSTSPAASAAQTSCTRRVSIRAIIPCQPRACGPLTRCG
jgi:hypothetical protein